MPYIEQHVPRGETMNAVETVEFLKAILTSIDEGIHVIDSEGITVYYNSVAARHDGLSLNDVMGRHVLDVFPSLDEETSTLLKVIQTGKPIINQQQSYTNLKGQKLITVNTTLPIDVNGKLIGAIEIAKDLTRIQQLSEKLLDLQAKVVGALDKKAAPLSATGAKYRLEHILTRDPYMEELKQRAQKAARTRSPIFVYGETGTGKELLVQSIHNLSERKDRPFIAQNCAALPAQLLESILFGTVKGSFTGAENRLGLFELADGGTLFLDELNALPLELQPKLLRVLQEGLVRRVGDTKVYPVNVRIMAATNISPTESLRMGELRADLYYRLNVMSFEIPPLRERKEDILPLAQHFIQRFNYQFDRLITGWTKEVERLWLRHPWPGNVRELEHSIEAAMNVVDGDVLKVKHLPVYLQIEGTKRQLGSMANGGEIFAAKSGEESAAERGEKHTTQSGEEIATERGQMHTTKSDEIPVVDRGVLSPPQTGKPRPLREALRETETLAINRAMEETRGNVSKAAELLDIPRQTLQYKLRNLRMQ
jgi:arginine utilization regulatory protein